MRAAHHPECPMKTRALPCLVALLFAAATISPALAAPRFVVLAPQIQSEEMRADVQELHASGALQSLVDALNLLFVIPRNVGVRFAECGEANAFFSPEDMQISMCVELLAELQTAFTETYDDEDERAEAVVGAFTAVLLHEAGHALVHVLEIPITGREEDAVDQLSAWTLIESEMGDAVLSSAASYYTTEQTAEDEVMADEHSLNQQRYFNLVCWVYGSNPDANADLLEEWELPEARAQRCPGEYAQLRSSWAKLLDGHLRG